MAPDADTVSVAGVVMLDMVKLNHETLAWLCDKVKLIGVPPLDRLTVWGCSVDALDVEKLRDAGLAVMFCAVMLTETLTVTGKQGEPPLQLNVIVPL
jgi:hypothetical protein